MRSAMACEPSQKSWEGSDDTVADVNCDHGCTGAERGPLRSIVISPPRPCGLRLFDRY